MSGSRPKSAEFPFKSRYIETEGSRTPCIEEGAGELVLFLHGNPASSHLLRNIIPHVSLWPGASLWISSVRNLRYGIKSLIETQRTLRSAEKN